MKGTIDGEAVRVIKIREHKKTVSSGNPFSFRIEILNISAVGGDPDVQDAQEILSELFFGLYLLKRRGAWTVIRRLHILSIDNASISRALQANDKPMQGSI